MNKAVNLIQLKFQAFLSRKQGEDPYRKIKEALDSMDNKLLTLESRLSMNRPQEQVNGSSGPRNQLASCTSEPAVTGDSSASNLRLDSDKNEAQVPSDIITSCVATLLMIQVTRNFWTREVFCVFQLKITHIQTHTLTVVFIPVI